MSTSSEPTNEELWAQPPAPATPPATHLPAVPVAAPTPAPLPAVAAPEPVRHGRGTLALAITSLGIGIPVTAISASTAGLPGLVVAWLGIVGVNMAYVWGQRRD